MYRYLFRHVINLDSKLTSIQENNTPRSVYCRKVNIFAFIILNASMGDGNREVSDGHPLYIS